ncbi:MAG: MlaD family protein [Desulfosarcinaceae bacterium]|nr:MlaD family protein [Desulfosarcinaceae bacterium]
MRAMAIVGAITLLLTLVACDSEGLLLNVTFDRIDGLEKGAPVRFEGNFVGQVEEVVYTTSGDYQVTLSIDEGFANACTTHTRFRIAPKAADNRGMAVEMIQGRPGGIPLTADSKIQGESISPSAALGITADLFKGLEKLGEQIEAFTREFQNIEESSAYQRLREELSALSESMVDAGRTAREKIEKEVLPRIESEIRQLRERLEKMGKEAEIAPLEEELERIRKAV